MIKSIVAASIIVLSAFSVRAEAGLCSMMENLKAKISQSEMYAHVDRSRLARQDQDYLTALDRLKLARSNDAESPAALYASLRFLKTALPSDPETQGALAKVIGAMEVTVLENPSGAIFRPSHYRSKIIEKYSYSAKDQTDARGARKIDWAKELGWTLGPALLRPFFLLFNNLKDRHVAKVIAASIRYSKDKNAMSRIGQSLYLSESDAAKYFNTFVPDALRGIFTRLKQQDSIWRLNRSFRPALYSLIPISLLNMPWIVPLHLMFEPSMTDVELIKTVEADTHKFNPYDRVLILYSHHLFSEIDGHASAPLGTRFGTYIRDEGVSVTTRVLSEDTDLSDIGSYDDVIVFAHGNQNRIDVSKANLEKLKNSKFKSGANLIWMSCLLAQKGHGKSPEIWIDVAKGSLNGGKAYASTHSIATSFIPQNAGPLVEPPKVDDGEKLELFFWYGMGLGQYAYIKSQFGNEYTWKLGVRVFDGQSDHLLPVVGSDTPVPKK